MSESIFTKLKSYTPRVGRDAKEDYLTELFSYMLDNVEGLKEEYVNFLHSKLEGHDSNGVNDKVEEISIETQVSIRNGRIDLLIQTGTEGFICEHKVYSGLSEGQIDKYSDGIEEYDCTKKYYTVLITVSAMQHSQKTDIALVWGDIYEFLIYFKKNNTLEVIDDFLITQLISYLKEQGLGRYEGISYDEIISNCRAIDLREGLQEIFASLSNIGWGEKVPKLNEFKQKLEPASNKYRWGRVGIDFFQEWKPGIFAGVLLDIRDHKIEATDKNLGPDFVIIVEASLHKKDSEFLKVRNSILKSPELNELRENLKINSQGFQVIDQPKNKWRVLVLKKPLINILKGKYKREDQEKALKDEIVKGLKLLCQDDLLNTSFSNKWID